MTPPNTPPADAMEAEKLNKCPKCGSPQPHLHPAVQVEGEVHICDDDFHKRITPQNRLPNTPQTAQELADRLGRMPGYAFGDGRVAELIAAFAEKWAAEARREAIEECAVKLEDEARRKLSSQYNKNRYEDGAQFHHAAAIVRALAEQQPLRETAPPEHPTEAMIEAGVRMHQEPRGGPPETLVHDIYQAMYDAWRAEQP